MKTIIITGTSRGIGLATAQKFLDEGWRVIGTHLHTPSSIVHPNFISIHFDQSSSEKIIGFVSEIKNIVPHIDVLVNNAAVLLDTDNEGVDMDIIRKAFEVDLFGLIDVTERILPFMSAGGHIINISSQYGSFSFPVDDVASTSYRMAKAALNMYTRTLSFRVAQNKIIVSSLDPGWVETDMGLSVANSLSRPDRKPKEPAEDIYRLVLGVTESGHFWRFGKKREW